MTADEARRALAAAYADGGAVRVVFSRGGEDRTGTLVRRSTGGVGVEWDGGAPAPDVDPAALLAGLKTAGTAGGGRGGLRGGL